MGRVNMYIGCQDISGAVYKLTHLNPPHYLQFADNEMEAQDQTPNQALGPRYQNN